MCGINIIKKINTNIDDINFHCKKRGPDKTTITTLNNITFIHNLLHITGDLIEQPFQNNNVVCLFNGEIFNYLDFNTDYKSDGECLLDLYEKYDKEFIKKLDGEFAICLIDFNKEIILISTDVFSTKPLFYCFEDDNFMISSYQSCIERNNMKNIHKLQANKTYVFDLNKFNKLYESSVYNFDLKQHKSNYNDWIKAYEESIIKRTKNTNKNIFVSLSSGYDSGSICIVLNKYNINYSTYTIVGKENIDILKNRYKINNKEYKQYVFNEKLYNEFLNINNQNCCDFYKNINNKEYSVLKDKASVGGSFIYHQSSKDNNLINLSGQGADEILSDYGFNGQKIKSHSCFGGKFPEDLSKIFPWESFYNGIGEALLMKEEIIGGSHGIENRYPFLDKKVVQEFLWLKSELKNYNYKAPLHYYLSIHKYPFEFKKIGFNNLY